jgi:hypothetical protein
VRSTRLLVGRLTVGGDEIEVGYADVFVVVREGEEGPGDNDWEVSVTSRSPRRVEPGEHDLVMETQEGSTLTGRAMVRFSDGTRHLFRGSGTLIGYVDE